MDEIKIIELQDMNYQDAMKLLIDELKMEAIHNPRINLLRDMSEAKKQFTDIIKHVTNDTLGKAILIDGKPAGFLAFYGPIENFFGNCKGAFSPLGYSAFGTQNRERIASVLLQNCIEVLLNRGITHVAISRYANDREIGELLNLSSFGMRCSDAMLSLETYQFPTEHEGTVDKELYFLNLHGQKRLEIKELDQALTEHLLKSPCCFITSETNFAELINDKEKDVIAAYWNQEIAGYMILKHGGETFLAENDKVRSICGCYVKPEFRHKGVAKALLDEVVRQVKMQGYTYLGTDYETINPNALRFWTKYFSPYTYSYIRRLDERLLEKTFP